MCDLFIYHGVAGSRPSSAKRPKLNEIDRLQIASLIFGLIPADLLRYQPAGKFSPLKPRIQVHLAMLGVPNPDDEILLDVLLRVGYQYARSHDKAFQKREKKSIRDLRALRNLYPKVRSMQGGRCVTCGLALPPNSESETLDHCLPWRLVGDPPNAVNWQIMCAQCNNAKGNYLSTLQVKESHNWLYGADSIRFGTLSRETRWVILQQRMSCEDCGKGPDERRLVVTRETQAFTLIPDLLSVHCLPCAIQQSIEIVENLPSSSQN